MAIYSDNEFQRLAEEMVKEMQDAQRRINEQDVRNAYRKILQDRGLPGDLADTMSVPEPTRDGDKIEETIYKSFLDGKSSLHKLLPEDDDDPD